MVPVPEPTETPSSRGPPRPLIAGLLGIMLLWMVGELLWWTTAAPAAVVDYGQRLEAICVADQGEGQDGWPLLIEALQHWRSVAEAVALRQRLAGPSAPKDPYDLSFTVLLGRPSGKGPSPQKPLADEMLRDRGAYELLAEAARCPRFVRPMSFEPPMTWTVDFPTLGDLRKLALARVASMRIAFEGNDEADRLAAFEQSLAIARALAHQAFAVDRMVADSIVELALTELQRELAERPLQEHTGRAFLAAMDRQLSFPPLSRVFETERACVLDFIQWCYHDDGHGSGRVDPTVLRDDVNSRIWIGRRFTGNPVLDRAGASLLAQRAEVTALANTFYDRLAPEIDRTPEDRENSSFDFRELNRSLTYRHFHLRWAIWNRRSTTIESDDARRTRAVATRIMVALEIHHTTHGAYPGALTDLAPEILPSVPTDPRHDGPLVYRRKAKEPNTPDGLGYDLYSLPRKHLARYLATDQDALAALPPLGGKTLQEVGVDLRAASRRSE